MPRRPSSVNMTDARRTIQALERENVPYRITLQPNGAMVFETMKETIEKRTSPPVLPESSETAQ